MHDVWWSVLLVQGWCAGRPEARRLESLEELPAVKVGQSEWRYTAH